MRKVIFARAKIERRVVLQALFSIAVACTCFLHMVLVQGAPIKGDEIAGTELRITDIWGDPSAVTRLSDIGRGKGIVFGPDISAPGNRKFYEKLGFAYFEDPDWGKILEGIKAFNRNHADRPLKIVFIQTHGTNGNGLKLQMGGKNEVARSYISIGALQEQLQDTGVELCLIAACNAGRLFRPEIYNTLNEKVDDPLFLSPTRGIFNASNRFLPLKSSVIVARRAENFLEMTHRDDASIFSDQLRVRLGFDVSKNGKGKRFRPGEFVTSYLFVQILMHDSSLHLTAVGFEAKISSRPLSSKKRVELLEQFFSYLEKLASRSV